MADKPDIFERFGFNFTDDQKRDLQDIVTAYQIAGSEVGLTELLSAMAQYPYPSIERLSEEAQFLRETSG